MIRAGHRHPRRACAALLPALGLIAAAVQAGPRPDDPAAPADPQQGEAAVAPAAAEAPTERFAVHGQATYTVQADDGFHAPYGGPNSLAPAQNRETVDASLFLGARLWQGVEAWVEPEVDQGFGLSDTLGVAGFPSGEAYKVGADQPYLRLQRAFVRVTLGTGGEREEIAPAAGTLGGSQAQDRWVFTLGKFSAPDIFDTNRYAHDPRGDFLNWAAIDAGTFDYAADAWGYTVGAAVERYLGSWTWRAGILDLSEEPNGPHLAPGFNQLQAVAEIEKRYTIAGRGGRLQLTLYDGHARMGLLDAAVEFAQATGTIPSTAAVRSYRTRAGASLNLEQPVTADLGVFARVGKASGNVEAYDFTDIDRTVEAGASLRGAPWHRPDDTAALAFVDNGISAARERYLALGGLGTLVGDGQLPHPRAEQIVEAYYQLAPWPWLAAALDYQWLRNPAYNADRGPVSIVALRLHASF